MFLKNHLVLIFTVLWREYALYLVYLPRFHDNEPGRKQLDREGLICALGSGHTVHHGGRGMAA